MNEWHHLAAVGDGASIRVFADGVLIGTGGGATANYGNSSFNFNIGDFALVAAAARIFSGESRLIVKEVSTSSFMAI